MMPNWQRIWGIIPVETRDWVSKAGNGGGRNEDVEEIEDAERHGIYFSERHCTVLSKMI